METFRRSRTAAPAVDPAVRRYNTARTDILWAVIFTVVNIVLSFVGADLYFLFSLSVPYYYSMTGYLIDMIIAVVMLAFFLMCYFFSKKHTGWMIAALIIFALDCAELGSIIFSLTSLTDITFASFIPDIILHIFVLVCLILGVASIKKYKAALAEDSAPIEPVDGMEPALPDDSKPVEAESSDPEPPTDTL